MLADLVVQTLMITPSGAFSPGPLTTASVVAGAVRPSSAARSGLAVAAGHMAFELPYVLALGLVATALASFQKPLAAVSLAFSLFFAYLTARGGLRSMRGGAGQTPGGRSSPPPFLAGVVFTGANPYFLMWWATVGLPLVGEAFRLGPLGVAAMYGAHVWMDYLWLSLMASLGGGASRLLSNRGYGYLLVALAALLALFGLNIFLKAFAGIALLGL
jgi:threonine/homoserine/homoserine lactone efflux protein